MIKGHRIERKISIDKFLDIIKNYKEEQVITTQHTFFRLAEKQRKVFKDILIRDYLLIKSPLLVGIQHNQLYAVFYDYGKNEALKLILDIQPNKIEIVTFHIISKEQIPRI